MRKHSKSIVLVLSGLILSGSLNAAPPPSATTPEALLWEKVNSSYVAAPVSGATLDLLQRFIDSYPNSEKLARARYLKAQISFQQKNYREALARFEYLLANHPKTAYADSALFRLAECYYNLKAYKSAQQKWRELTKKHRKSHLYPEALYALALLEAKDGRWGYADDMLETLRNDYPAFGKLDHVRELSGIVLFNMGEFAQAAKFLEDIRTSTAGYYRGLSLFTLKLYDDAIASLNLTTDAQTGPFTETAEYLKAEGFFQKRNYTLSSSAFDTFLKKYPSSNLRSYAMLRVGISQAQTGFYHDALEMANQAATLATSSYPTKVYGQFLRGSMLIKIGDFPKALGLFTSLINNKEYSELAAAALLQKAWAHKKLNQRDQSMASLRAFEQKYPSNPDMPLGLYLMGAQAFEDGDYGLAAGRFESSIIRYQYTPLSEMGLAMMVMSYHRAQQYDRLLTSATSILKIFEKNYASIGPFWRAQSYYFIGDAYMQVKEPANAIPYFQRVVKEYTESALAPRAQLALAWCQLDIGHYDEARKSATPILALKNANEDLKTSAQFLLGSTYFNAKDYNRAIKYYGDFAKKNPNHELVPYAIYGVGLAYYQQKIYGSAIDEWNKLIEKYPNHEVTQDSVMHVGDLYLRGGKYLQAAEIFKVFLHRWPESETARQAHWLLAQSYYNAKDDDKAINAYRFFIKTFPKDPDVDNAEKQIELSYYRRGESGSPEKLEEFIMRYPKSPFAPQARFKLATMAMDQKAYGRAVQEWGLLIRNYPDSTFIAEAYYQLGQAYEELKDSDQALIQYRAVLKEYSNKPNALDAAFRMGTLHFKKENYKEAAEAFEFVLARKAQEDVKANACFNLAVSYENLGKIDQAAKYYVQFAGLSKDGKKNWESLINAAALYRKMGNHAESIKIYSKLFKSTKDKPTRLRLTNAIAECYKDSGNPAKAMSVYQKLIGMEPVHHDFRLAGLAQLAFLYEQKKDWDGAIKVYEKIVISGGRQDWVKSAKDRIQILNRQLAATEPAKR